MLDEDQLCWHDRITKTYIWLRDDMILQHFPGTASLPRLC